MSDQAEPAFLAPLTMEQLTSLLTQVDAALAEGRALREKIVRTMNARRNIPQHPEASELHSCSA